MAIISVKKVSKVYGSKKVLDEVSFDIEPGEIFGLLGSNGAGKSTLTSIILGHAKASSGTVVIQQSKSGAPLKKISLVPQDAAFYRDFSVEKNMSFFASIYGLKGKLRKQRVNFLLKWLELEEFRDTKSDFLSGGYQRLLNIALSILHDPEIIFLDEPTVGLDPKMRQMFWAKIEELHHIGKTIILTTHYMDEAEKLCTRVALLKKGKLLSVGNPFDLIKQYGGIKVVVFEVSGGVSETDVEKIRDVLKERNVVCRKNYLFIPFSLAHSVEKVTAVTEWLMKRGYNIVSSTTREPSLEDVFLNMTGEKMKGQE